MNIPANTEPSVRLQMLSGPMAASARLHVAIIGGFPHCWSFWDSALFSYMPTGPHFKMRIMSPARIFLRFILRSSSAISRMPCLARSLRGIRLSCPFPRRC